MNRVEMFAPIHKALRWSASRALNALAVCAGDSIQTMAALVYTRELLDMHAIHAEIEDAVVIPAIEARRPGAAARLVDAHQDHAACLPALRERVATVESDPTPRAIHRLYLEITRFVADNFLHMYEEETLAEPLLEEIYSQRELEELSMRARTFKPPAELAVFAFPMKAVGVIK